MAGPHHAYVEDCDTDDDNSGIPLRKSPGPPNANVAAKRAHPSDMGADRSPVLDKVVHSDLQSDSGYSSHTAATVSSAADSAQSATSHSPPAAVVDAVPYPPTHLPPSPPQNPQQRRRPTLVADDRDMNNNKNTTTAAAAHGGSRKAPLQRAPSQSSKSKPSKDRRSTTSEACNVPGCTDCPSSKRTRGRAERPERPKLDHSRDSAINLTYPPYDQVSQHSEPAPSSYASPRSPTYRQPPNYAQEAAIIQPAQNPRRRAASNARARPVSYHGGDPSQSFYPAGLPGSYSSQPHDHHGPPPASSAHYAMQNMPPHQVPQYQSMYGATPPNTNGFYQPQPHPMQVSAPYENPGSRPTMHSRTSSNNYHARGPMSSQYGQPLITHGSNLPSARFPSQPQPLALPPSQPQPQPQRRTKYADQESSEYGSSESEEEEEQVVEARKPHAIMGPPKTKPAPQRRPSMSRRSQTTQVYQPDRQPMSQSMVLPERPRDRESRSRTKDTAASRAASSSRPPLVRQKAKSSYTTPQADVMVERSKSRRRQSQVYQLQQSEYEVEGRRQPKVYRQEDPYKGRRQSTAYEYEIEDKRRPRVYHPEYELAEKRRSKVYTDDMYQDAIVPVRRRKTDADVYARRREESSRQPQPETLEHLEDDVEAYQQRMRGSDAPLNDQIHRAAKRSSFIQSGPSHAGSGSDKQTRVSHVTTATGEIRLKIDGTAPLSLQFNGDMEGRTLEYHPGENGMAELVIGNARETTYQSERGSNMGSNGGRKAIQSRRDAEELSTKSTHTSRSRRDRDRETERAPTPRAKVLQRRRASTIDHDY